MKIQKTLFDAIEQNSSLKQTMFERAYALYQKELDYGKRTSIIQFREGIIHTKYEYSKYLSYIPKFFNFGDYVQIDYTCMSDAYRGKKYHGKRGIVYWHSSLTDRVDIVLEDLTTLDVGAQYLILVNEIISKQ